MMTAVASHEGTSAATTVNDYDYALSLSQSAGHRYTTRASVRMSLSASVDEPMTTVKRNDGREGTEGAGRQKEEEGAKMEVDSSVAAADEGEVGSCSSVDEVSKRHRRSPCWKFG